MEEEIAELKSRDAELEQLSNTEDHIQFLKVNSDALLVKLFDGRIWFGCCTVLIRTIVFSCL